jgi:hypothetical protein
MSAAMQSNGLDGLVFRLEVLGANPTIEDNLLSFTVKAPSGSLSGTEIRSGMGLEETGSWPLIPPHWVHFPDSVEFQTTNAQPSSKAGWLKHSRNIVSWGDAADPVQSWLSHVRAVLMDAR